MSSRRSRRAGSLSGTTLSGRRGLPEEALRHHLLQVAVAGGDDPHVRLIAVLPPTGMNSPCCRTRKGGLGLGGMSPISSRKSVPLSACSKRRRAWRTPR
jgi:hypothetical protein